MSGQLQEHRAGGREFQILGDATEKLRAPNDVKLLVNYCLSNDRTTTTRDISLTLSVPHFSDCRKNESTKSFKTILV